MNRRNSCSPEKVAAAIGGYDHPGVDEVILNSGYFLKV
jgi:hypothetical protein